MVLPLNYNVNVGASMRNDKKILEFMETMSAASRRCADSLSLSVPSVLREKFGPHAHLVLFQIISSTEYEHSEDCLDVMSGLAHTENGVPEESLAAYQTLCQTGTLEARSERGPKALLTIALAATGMFSQAPYWRGPTYRHLYIELLHQFGSVADQLSTLSTGGRIAASLIRQRSKELAMEERVRSLANRNQIVMSRDALVQALNAGWPRKVFGITDEIQLYEVSFRSASCIIDQMDSRNANKNTTLTSVLSVPHSTLNVGALPVKCDWQYNSPNCWLLERLSTSGSS